MASIGGPSQMKSLHDLELEGIVRGPDAARAAESLADSRAGTQGGGTYGQARTQAVQGSPDAKVTWEMLQDRHPEWDLVHWQECRALYAGGKRLLGDKALMKRMFPQNPYEAEAIYKERAARAHYFPYPGTIIDSLLAGLSSDPLRISFGKIDPKSGDLKKADGAEWWEDFVADVSDESSHLDGEDDEPDENDDDNAHGLPMHHFLIEVLRECEQTRCAWVRCDLPTAPEPDEIKSKLDEERALQPYLCLVPAECVIDWEYDERGEKLLWVMTLEKTTPRVSIKTRRGKIERHCYTLWTETDWARYEIDVDPSKPPPNDTIYAPAATDAHPFGCVPFDRISLPEGMWAMGKLHNLAREHFNKRCAMSWAEYKALFPILYEFYDDKETGGDLPVAAEDLNRGTNQTRSQGYSQQRRGGDRAEYVGPAVEPFKAARESCNDVMREMHRVMYSMALSANMDKQALARSGDSKQQDQDATQTILIALGLLMRRASRVLLALVARGRGQSVPPSLITGLEHFDITGVTQAIADAVQLFTGVPIKSKTFATLYLSNLYRKALGDSVTDEQVTTIRDEIDETLAAEELIQQQLPAPGQTQPTADDDQGGGGEDDDDNEDDDTPPPRKIGPIKSARPMKR